MLEGQYTNKIFKDNRMSRSHIVKFPTVKQHNDLQTLCTLQTDMCDRSLKFIIESFSHVCYSTLRKESTKERVQISLRSFFLRFLNSGRYKVL